MTDSIYIQLIQNKFLVGDIRANCAKIITLAEQARQCNADLVVFPELALTGYPPEDLFFRRGFMQQVTQAIETLRQEIKGIDVVFGAPHQQGEQLFNSAYWLRDAEILGIYNKYTLPNYAVFDEKRYFSAGNTATVIDIKGVKIGLSICEDIWQADSADDAKAAGAVSMLVLNASPFHLGKRDERITVLKTRSLETGMSMAYVNLLGGQDELVFDGESMLLNNNAELLACAADFETAQINYRLNSKGQIESQEGIHEQQSEAASIYKSLLMAVHDYVKNNGFESVVIGLSGGVDSALTLAIAVDALGAEHVHAVMMPSQYTAQISLDDAAEEAKILAVDYRIIPIEASFNAFLGSLKDDFDGLEADTTEENIQARCRGVLLMALSNKFARMVLTTGNKSEMSVGYSTLYGDMAGGFAPLKDVSKLWVYRLCDYRNSLSRVIPQRVLERAPSAELRPDQEDQDSLPPYDILDAILQFTVEEDMPRDDIIAQGYDAQTVDRIIKMVQINEYKRRQAPPGVRITRRAFGRDRRYPITSGYRR